MPELLPLLPSSPQLKHEFLQVAPICNSVGVTQKTMNTPTQKTMNIDHGPIGPRRERAARGMSLRIHMIFSNFHEQLSRLCHTYGDLCFIGPATKIMHLSRLNLATVPNRTLAVFLGLAVSHDWCSSWFANSHQQYKIWISLASAQWGRQLGSDLQFEYNCYNSKGWGWARPDSSLQKQGLPQIPESWSWHVNHWIIQKFKS